MSKTVTGSIERSDSMESVIEEIVNSNSEQSIENVLGLNEKTLEFYDWSKKIEFWNAIKETYIKTARILFFHLALFGAFFCVVSVLITPLIRENISKDVTKDDIVLIWEEGIVFGTIALLSLIILFISFTWVFKTFISITY